ncbi:MAG TPA: bifunctional phosphoglucose/phosphomannose isomerase [Actinomycetota bacterium]|nr:bifunctional phosphoglucose/phosphomannose isomerase [Actinomycetota bacterium]
MTTPPVELSLDDPVSIRAVDSSGMLALAAALGQQLEDGFALGRSAERIMAVEGLRSVVVCGMGGSGVTGDVLRAALSADSAVPIITSKGYALPSFCGPETLVLAASYSGNTEETIAAYREAVSRGCRVVAIASGGQLLAAAGADGVPVVGIPPNVLAPRAALGYLTGSALAVVERAGAIGDQTAEVQASRLTLEDLASRLGAERPIESNPAKQVAAWLRGGTVLVWGTEGVAEAAALRWKTQLNENAKVPAFWGVLPELDHNEVEGSSGEGSETQRIVILRSHTEPPRMRLRVPATVGAMTAAGLETQEVWCEGSGALAQTLSLIMMGDFVSVYLAVLRGVDPTPIPILTGLKERRTSLGTNE